MAAAYPITSPCRRPTRAIRRDKTWAMNAVPMVTVAVAIPPHGVDCPRIRCTTKAPTVTDDDNAAAAASWPRTSTLSVRRCTASMSTRRVSQTSGVAGATHSSTTLDRRSTITLNPIANINHAAPAVRPDSRPTVGSRTGVVVVTSARTPVPGGVVVTTTIVDVVTMPGPTVVLVTIVGPTVVVVVTTFGAAVDVVVEAGGDVVCGTVVIVG